MRRRRKTCGAPLDEIKCDYCGTTHGETEKNDQNQ